MRKGKNRFNMASVKRIDLDGSDLADFLNLAGAVYGADPNYSAPFGKSVLADLRRGEFEDRQDAFLAFEKGRAAARLVARLSPDLVDADQRPYGLLGFFEAKNSAGAARAIFQAAIEWLRDRGAGPIVGPMNGDTWHAYRFNIGPFDRRPFLMEPYNPPYYPELWRSQGFAVLERYCSKRVDDLPAVIAALTPRLDTAVAAGYRFERIAVDRFEHELERLYELSRRIFAGNFLYTEISRGRFLEIYRSSRPLIDPDLVTFARDADGRDAGFLFAFPDHFRAVAAMRGKSGLAARLRFLVARKPVDTVNLKSLGVVEEHRMHGLGAALMCHAYKTAHDKGYKKANLCLILDGNPSGRLEAGRGDISRRYELYRLTGGDAIAP